MVSSRASSMVKPNRSKALCGIISGSSIRSTGKDNSVTNSLCSLSISSFAANSRSLLSAFES